MGRLRVGSRRGTRLFEMRGRGLLVVVGRAAFVAQRRVIERVAGLELWKLFDERASGSLVLVHACSRLLRRCRIAVGDCSAPLVEVCVALAAVRLGQFWAKPSLDPSPALAFGAVSALSSAQPPKDLSDPPTYQCSSVP